MKLGFSKDSRDPEVQAKTDVIFAGVSRVRLLRVMYSFICSCINGDMKIPAVHKACIRDVTRSKSPKCQDELLAHAERMLPGEIVLLILGDVIYCF